ncbi:MAG: hypothetical protein OEY23_01520 [Acidimicrobiia bacterium]|nr:hypothetical protein [Acidimicrobiia bacterium]
MIVLILTIAAWAGAIASIQAFVGLRRILPTEPRARDLHTVGGADGSVPPELATLRRVALDAWRGDGVAVARLASRVGSLAADLDVAVGSLAGPSAIAEAVGRLEGSVRDDEVR